VASAQRQHGVISRRQLLAAGLSVRTIRRRIETGRLEPLHREVYALTPGAPSLRGRWLAAVLACGDEAVLSHRSAAALWGLIRPRPGSVEVCATVGRRRPGIVVHEGGIHGADRAMKDRVPVTSVARTLFDCAEVVDEQQLALMFEEADRLGLLEMPQLEEVCSRGRGRRALRPIHVLIEEARTPTWTRTELENRFSLFCREYRLPPCETNVEVLGHEVDVLWPRERLIVELDSWTFHRHRAAFERDRSKDVSRQVAGYRAIRVTDRRLKREPDVVAGEIRCLLAVGG
jgi:very-short-patch-repair endonuclease